MSGIVDWGLAERAAVDDDRRAGRAAAAPPRPLLGGGGRELLRGGDRGRLGYAGLGEVEAPPVAELIDRRRWARNALAASPRRPSRSRRGSPPI